MTAPVFVTMTVDATDATGAAANATVTFTPSATVSDESVPQVLADVPIQAAIVNGQLQIASGEPVQLLAQGSTGLTVEGLTGFWWWTVSVQWTAPGPESPAPDTWSFMLPASPGSVDLWSTQGTPAVA